VKKRKLMATIAMTAVLGLVGFACNNGSSSSGTSSPGGSNVKAGGTYRTATVDFGYTDAFDPTGEYLGQAWGLYSEMLLRGLMGYNHQGPDQGGDTPIPDIATGMPTISSDGLTYSFTLKNNVMFGPPLNRAVTSHDIEYAFERINLGTLAAQYGNYYCAPTGVIKGMTCQAKTLAPVSGIETPDDTHIIFHLSAPDGDLLYRLAMPATAAVPQEVAKCFTNAGEYGRDVISSGPYMIMGEDKLNISSCNTIKPISGYNPNKGMTLVRNPAYVAASDSPDVRANYLDGVQISIDTNLNDIFQKIQAGTLDGSYADTPPSAVEAQYVVPHDEPAGSAVRRRSRPKSDEPRHGQGRDAEGLRWSLARGTRHDGRTTDRVTEHGQLRPVQPQRRDVGERPGCVGRDEAVSLQDGQHRQVRGSGLQRLGLPRPQLPALDER
jgi:peptide/nickel transport system substrate-binding protein